MKHTYQVPVEVHSHTIHSDGQFTVSELVEAAVAFGYKGLILTDHNSSAGFLEMSELDSVKNGSIVTLHGMEWTTYFGHMLVHDADYDVDWRKATIDTIDDYMNEVRTANGLVGIAHPFDIGSPICTGCHWEYRIKDYSLVNYIEIWNSNQPQNKPESTLAYDLWLEKLNEGYEISCSAGRDWHRPDKPEANMGITYLELPNEEVLTTENFKTALRLGNYYITLGPRSNFEISTSQGTSYLMGNRVPLNSVADATVRLQVMPTELPALSQFEVSHVTLSVWNNQTLLYRSEPATDLTTDLVIEFDLTNDLTKGFIRFEVRGDFRGVPNTLLIVGNPIYLK